MARSVALNLEEMKRLVPPNELGFQDLETQTNFLFVHAPMGGPALYDALLRKGVIVQPLVPYGLLDHVRISIGLPEENTRLLEALGEPRGESGSVTPLPSLPERAVDREQNAPGTRAGGLPLFESDTPHWHP